MSDAASRANSILAFTRSLGETGATMICAGLVETAPIMVVGLRKQTFFSSASFLSLILIFISLGLLILVKIIARRNVAQKEFWQIHLSWEKFLSKPIFTRGIKLLSGLLMLLLILVPSFYIFTQIGVKII